MMNQNIKFLPLLFLFACTPEKQLNARGCTIQCYEKGNDAPVYSTRCPHDPQVLTDYDTVRVHFIIKHNMFNVVYSQFQKINENVVKYDWCDISIKGEGRFH
jgi:hypothetical protein